MSPSGQLSCKRASLIAGALFAVLVGGCAKVAKLALLPSGPLAPVAALPAPKLPAWIVQISPTGESVDTLGQIRIIFKNDLIPVEAIESPDRQRILRQFDIAPALPGHFRFLTPRMVGFQLDRALPKAARVRITLKAGLEDLSRNRLASDLAWTFSTQPITITDLPGNVTDAGDQPSPGPVGLTPTLTGRANMELDVDSLAKTAALVSKRTNESVPVDVELQQTASPPPDQHEDQPQSAFDQSTKDWIYTFTPRVALRKATHYELVIKSGVLPAHGNLPTKLTYTGSIDTYAPLAFSGVQMTDVPDEGGPTARFARGQAFLKFNNPLDGSSLAKSITIAPAPKDASSLLQFNDGDSGVGLNPIILDSGTTYTISIAAGLKDAFGQTLGTPLTATYSTGSVAPDFWAPSGLNVFPAGTNLQLDASAVNLPDGEFRAGYRVLQPADLVYIDDGDPTSALPWRGAWAPSSVAQVKNVTATVHVPLRQKLGGATGMLAYGMTARTYRFERSGRMVWREPVYVGLVQLTDLGIFAQWFPHSAMVRVNHLSDGSPAAKAAVTVYISKTNSTSKPQASPCASGVAGPDGVVQFSNADVQACLSGANPGEAPALLTVAREGQDWAYVRTYDYSGYGYGIDAGWPAATPPSRGTIFSDRQLYQPGETAWLAVEAYYLSGDAVVQDRNARYRVTLEAPDGSKSDIGSWTTNRYGTFSFSLRLKKDQPLGYYAVHAKGQSGAVMDGQFQVAEFKPPNFKVTLSLDRDFASIGETVQAKGQSDYLFGSPVEGGRASFYVTRQQTQVAPKGWDAFSFGRQWFWPEQAPSVPSDVLQTTTTLGSDGSGSQAVQVASDLPYAMTYRVDMQTTDVSNLSVADSKSFTALPSDKLIGLQSDWVADQRKPFAVQVVVVDPKGAAIEGQHVHVELDSMKYSAATQIVSGGEVPHDQIQYSPVAAADVRSGKDAQSITLTAPQAGPYRVRANFADAKDEVTASDVQIWVSGPQPVNWGSQNPDQLQIKLDKAEYKPGDEATVLIQSPYRAGDLYFAVVRANTIYHELVKVSGGAPRVRFRVTQDMLPNAAVEAVLVRTGPALSTLQPGSLDSLSRVGFAPFSISLGSKYLKVGISPASAKIEPGGHQIVRLRLTDAGGAPVRGQFTVMVVNESVLQLSGYRPPDLVATIYAQRTIDTRFGDNRPSVVLAPIPSPVQKGWGYGGGFAPGAASTRIRTNFKALAYFNGALTTGANGRADVSFNVPDDLTTWRVLAVATGESSPAHDLRFGGGDATFIATKPLVTNPVLPQFVRPGDKFDGGVTVTNNTGQSGSLSIDGEVEPQSVGTMGGGTTPTTLFLDHGQTRNRVHLDAAAPGSATQAYRFTMQAGAAIAVPSQVLFVTRLGNASDAFEVPLLTEQPQLTEYVVSTGVTETHVSIPLNIQQHTSNDAGGLHVRIASSVLADLSLPAAHSLTHAEALPFLEPLASDLAMLADSKILIDMLVQKSRAPGDTHGRDAILAQTAAQDIQNLQRLQLPDGGFASWPSGRRSDRFVSPYAARALARAQSAGLAVDPDMLSRLKSFLERQLANPSEGGFCTTTWCKNYLRLQALLALSDLGATRNDFLSDIYDGRGDFDVVTRLQLAGYLTKVSGWQSEADAMAAKLQQSVYQTGRFATIDYPEEWGWLASPAAARAEALRLFLARGADQAMLDKLVNSLLALRTKGWWQNSYDSAQALGALVDDVRAQPAPPNFSALVTLAGKTLLQTQFAGYQHPEASADVGMGQLPRGSSALTLQKTGPGHLHYVVTLGYLLPGNQPGALHGIRVTREIRPANQDSVVGSMGIAVPDNPLMLAAGQVWDIGLQVITDHPIDNVVITDPLPAGLEAVDASFQTSTPYFQARGDSWEITYQQIHRDKIVAYASRLEAGVYDVHYLARSVTPGTFSWPGASAFLQYAPEEFGRTASTTLVVENP